VTLRGRMQRRLLLALVILVALAAVAFARPGGGETFSGGGGHGGGGGGGAELVFELIYWTLRLVIYYPQVGLPLLAIVIIGVCVSAYRQHQNKDWDSGPPVELHRAISVADKRPDPDFSQPVFEDFAFRLFSTAHRSRTAADKLAIYGLGLGLYETLQFLHGQRPGFDAFQDWILARNGGAVWLNYHRSGGTWVAD